MKRKEYPRPQFVRREWQCLNGSWEFAFDDENRAQADHWELDSFRPEGRIEVPFCFESKLSGIGDTSIHDHVFYKRNFTVPEEWKGRRVLLHFEAVDYSCRVFVNEKLCTEHTGGNAGFCADITDYLRDGEQTLAVAVYDPAQDETIPPGKTVLAGGKRRYLVYAYHRYLAECMDGACGADPYHPCEIYS